MKYLVPSILVILIVVNSACMIYQLEFSIVLILEKLFFILFVNFPVLYSLQVSLLYLKGKAPSNAIPITGVVIGILPLLVHYDFHNSVTTDANGALIFAVLPFYQSIILCLVGAVSYAIRLRIKNQESKFDQGEK